MLGPFDVFPRLNTDCLVWENFLPEDLPALIRNVNNPVIATNVINIPYPYGESLMLTFRLAFVHQGFCAATACGICIGKKDTNEVIGEAGIHFSKDRKPPKWVIGLVSRIGARTIPLKQ